ncbi:MAG TPA: tetratricopeptide repeat protein [Verrucomicrobiae bacterium]
MSAPFKIILYVVLVILASISGYYAMTNFGRMMDRAGDRHSDLEQIEPEAKPSTEVTSPESTATNPASATTQPTNTNVAAVANALSLLTNKAAGSTNVPDTNAIAASVTNIPTAQDVSGAVPSAGGSTRKTAAKAPGGGRIGLWTAIFLISLVVLGIMIARDVSNFLGNRALETIYNDEGKGVANPEYEEAEQAWANGRHLEAIGLMRDYLAKHPREQHVAIRIAEIYEKDLGNHLAAALEYEEVLKKKLPPERWGWAAIHLCNLYFKLGQEQKAYDLLRRLVKDYPETPAADKARKRLEQVDGASLEQLATESNVTPRTPAAPADDGPPSNLPPGFRPKK